jgi:hypothetical protein
MATNEEFIHAWSDDLVTLRNARTAVLSVTQPGAATKVANAAFCRHLAICIVGSVEIILSVWLEKDRSNILAVYFAEKAENGKRIDSLVSAFAREGFSVERTLFEDYLAIKYLRNTIEHSKWKDNQKEFVRSRGFPTDVREFKLEDFNRMSEVFNSVAIYIAQTEFEKDDHDGFEQLVRILAE